MQTTHPQIAAFPTQYTRTLPQHTCNGHHVALLRTSARCSNSNSSPVTTTAPDTRPLDALHLPEHDVPAAFDALASAFSTHCGVAAGPTPLGRGLIARDPAMKGARLLSIDRAGLLCLADKPSDTGDEFARKVLQEWQLLHGRLPPLLLNYVLSGDTGWFPRMTAWLLWLASHGSGPWQLYTQMLPTEWETCCLMNYTPQEAAEFQDPALEARSYKERNIILGLHERIYASGAGSVLGSLQLAPTPLDTLWAAAMVNSRSFSDAVGDEVVSIMAPCADMANHFNKPRATYRYNNKRSCFELRAARLLRAGEEVTISYGCMHKDNAELMKDYGFVVPGNTNDRIAFAAPGTPAPGLTRPAGSPQLHALRLVKALDMPSWWKTAQAVAEEGAGGLLPPRVGATYQDGVPTEAPEELIDPQSDDPFADFEAARSAEAAEQLKVSRARQQAVVLSLRPFFRQSGVAVSERSDWLGMDEAQLQEERAAVDELLAQCRGQMAGVGGMQTRVRVSLHTVTAAAPTSIATDEALVEDVTLSPRHRQAVATRLERKRLLQAGIDVLDTYQQTLL